MTANLQGFGGHAAAGRAEQARLVASLKKAPETKQPVVEVPVKSEGLKLLDELPSIGRVKGQCCICKKHIGKGVHFHERACRG